MKQSFARLESRLDSIEYKINGLHQLHQASMLQQESQFRRLQEQIDWTVLAKLYSSLESLADIESGRQAGYPPGILAERIREVRMYIKSQLQSSSWRESSSWDVESLRARMLILLYGQSVASEAYAWRLAGETSSANALLMREAIVVQERAREMSLWALQHTPAQLGLIQDWDALNLHELSWIRCVLNREDRDPSSLGVHSQNAWFSEIKNRYRRNLVQESMEEKTRKVNATKALCFPLVEAAESLIGLQAEYAHLDQQNIGWKDWEQDPNMPVSKSPLLIIR